MHTFIEKIISSVSAPENTSDDLEEVTTRERIELVDGDSVRRWGQIIIAFILIGVAVGYLGYYTIFLAGADFQLSLAEDMRVMVIMGIGAALAIFGLGRTVGRKTNGN